MATRRQRYTLTVICLIAGGVMVMWSTYSREPKTSKKAIAIDQSAPPAALVERRAPVPGAPTLTLADQLHKESASRPPGAVKAEKVFARLAAVGLKLEKTRQYLATTVGAAYCAGTRTDQHVSIAVCEYPNAEAAKRGVEQSLTKFASITGRHIQLNGQTMLTATHPNTANTGENAKARAQIDYLVDIFSELSPQAGD